MIREKQKRLAIHRDSLDELLSSLKNLNIKRPKHGWVKTVREVLGMSIRQLGKRTELAPTTITRLEDNEVRGVITLKSLNRLAEALECELVYSFVPKTTFRTTLVERAGLALAHEERRAKGTMALEDQYAGEINSSIEKSFLIGTLDKRLWEDK